MVERKAFLFIHDSLGLGTAALSSVSADDFTRWTGTTWPSTFPKDVSIPDVEVLTPTLPNGATLTTTADGAPTATVIPLLPAGLTGVVADTYAFLKTSSGAARGDVIEVASYATPSVTLTGGFSVAPAVGDTIEIWTDARKVGSIDATATIITKAAAGINDFTSADEDKHVVVIAGTGVGQSRRTVDSSAETLTVDTAFSPTLDSTSAIRVLTDTSTVEGITTIAGNCTLQPMRFFHDDGQSSYSTGLEYPNWYGQPLIAPTAHASNNAINYIPETMWQLRSHSAGAIYCICVGGGGATLAPYNIGTAITNPLGYSWVKDIIHNDLRPDSEDGLIEVAKAQITALKALVVAAGDTLSIEGVFVTVGTNDALNEAQSDQFEANMRRLRRHMRDWLADGFSQISATSIKWMMATTAPSRTYSTTVDIAIKAVAEDDIASGVVDISGFTFAGDDVHLNQVGALELGAAFGEAYAAAVLLQSDATTPEDDRPTLADLRTRVKRRWEGSTTSNAAIDIRVDQFLNDSIKEMDNTFGDGAHWNRLAESQTLSGGLYPARLILARKVRRIIKIESETYPGRSIVYKGHRYTGNGRTEISLYQADDGPYIVHYVPAFQKLVNDSDRTLIPEDYCELLEILTCKRLAETSGNVAMAGYYANETARLMKYVWRNIHAYDRFRQGQMSTIEAFSEWRNGPGQDYLGGHLTGY